MQKCDNLLDIAAKTCVVAVLNNVTLLGDLPLSLRILVGKKVLKVLTDLYLDLSARNSCWNETNWADFFSGDLHPLVPQEYRQFGKGRKRDPGSARLLVRAMREVDAEVVKGEHLINRTRNAIEKLA